MTTKQGSKPRSNNKGEKMPFSMMGVFPLELTLESVAKSGVKDENPEKAHKKFVSVSSPQQEVVHPGLSGSTSGPDLGLGCFSTPLDGKLPGQDVNP